MELDSTLPEVRGWSLQQKTEDHDFGAWRFASITTQCKKKTCCKKYAKGKSRCKKCPKK